MSDQTASYATEILVNDNLIAGNSHLLVADKVTLISGQNLSRGAALGKITASSKFTLSESSAGDGSEEITRILADDCDASAGDAECIVYRTGHFRADHVTLGTGHTTASVTEALHEKGIELI